jgi:hypothetical protein
MRLFLAKLATYFKVAALSANWHARLMRTLTMLLARLSLENTPHRSYERVKPCGGFLSFFWG